MKPSLPTILSFNGGYVDTAGFLALQGLFSAHVTGNFVTFGASMALGVSGAAAKLMALPVFCIVIIAVRLAGYMLRARNLPALRILLVVKCLLLAVAAVLALVLGPFPSGDAWQAIVTGMVLVSAMAIQNAVHRVHLTSAPPSTMVTGTTTQIMLDLADLILPASGETRAELRARILRLAPAVIGFAFGCGCAALAFILVGTACFLVPPLVAVLGLIIHRVEIGTI